MPSAARGVRPHAHLTHVLRRSGRTLHDALDHHGRDAREHGLGHRGRQHVGDRVQPVHLLLIGYALTKPDVRVVATEDVLAWMRANMSRKL
jgi:hypothetical protein